MELFLIACALFSAACVGVGVYLVARLTRCTHDFHYALDTRSKRVECRHCGQVPA